MARSFAIAVATLLNTLVLFAVQWVVVTRLGTGTDTDALFSSMVVPTLVLNITAAALGYVLVPVLALADSAIFSRLVFTFVLAIGAALVGISAILWMTSRYWIAWIAPGFASQTLLQTAALAKVQLLGVAFTGVTTVLTAAYNARRRFLFPAWCSVLASLAALGWVACFLEKRGVVAAAEALALRPLALTVLQLRIMRPLRAPMFSDQVFRSAVRRLLPLSVGSAYYKTDQLVDRLLASLAPSGMLSVLHLAQQLYGAANQMLVASIAAPTVPVLARFAAQAPERFWDEVRRVLLRLLGVGALVFAAILYPGEFVLRAVFQHGSFSASDVHSLWVLMIALGLAWAAGLAGQVLSNAFYSAGDTTTPTKIGVVGFTIGIGLKIVGFAMFGVMGIAVATGLYSIGNAVAMTSVLRRRYDRDVTRA